MMNLRFPESEINHWANRYTERQRAENRTREHQLINLKNDIQDTRLPHQTRIAHNSTLEIPQTRSPYFRKHR